MFRAAVPSQIAVKTMCLSSMLLTLELLKECLTVTELVAVGIEE